MSRPGFTIGLTWDQEQKRATLDSEDRYRQLMGRLTSGRYTVTIEKEVHSRSAAQNRAYWLLVVGSISDHTGYEPDEVHELLKVRCNPKTITIINRETGESEEQVIGGSTTGLNVEEFSAYYRRCQQFAAETLDCYCSDPNEDSQFSEKPAPSRRVTCWRT